MHDHIIGATQLKIARKFVSIVMYSLYLHAGLMHGKNVRQYQTFLSILDKMKFSTRQDTDLSAQELFQAVSNFSAIERMMSRRGAGLRRMDSLSQPGAGMNWLISFDWRGRRRELSMELIRYEPSEILEFSGQSDQFGLALNMTVVALTKSKSRFIFEADVTPRSMKSRLILQTAKLGKSQLDKRFAAGIADFVTSLTTGRA